MKKRRGLVLYLTTISTWNQGPAIAQNLFVTTRHKPYCPLKIQKYLRYQPGISVKQTFHKVLATRPGAALNQHDDHYLCVVYFSVDQSEVVS
jgi:hypothetical protein